MTISLILVLLLQLYLLAEFLTTKIYQPIKEAMEFSISNPRHIIARRRLHWLAERCDRRLEVVLQNPTPVMTPSLVENLRVWIKEWKFTPARLGPELLEAVMQEGGKSVRQTIKQEISEGVCVMFYFLYPISYESLTQHC